MFKMSESQENDIVRYLIACEPTGATVREVQEQFKISARTARELCQRFGKPHVYKGSGISYILNREKFENHHIVAMTKNQAKYEEIRRQILEWMYEGNIDVEAWAADPLKRPPSFFFKGD